MQILKDIIGFIKALSQIDYLLYFAVLVLIILIVSLIYIIRTSEEEEETMSTNSEIEDLKTIVSDIENREPQIVKLNDYEAEQEEKAIISYEELLAKNKMDIKYEEENMNNDEISIKKINLDTIMEKPKENKHIGFYSYEREEEFLKSLQALNKLLN